uniref:Ribosomal protein L16 n=1 Tax=Babesia duncani TaxID=323732 RepID=A0A385GNK2_9APIC|nr:ribosomal protein L16 [Babesia duncani]
MNQLLCPKNIKLYNNHNYKFKHIHRNNILHYGDWGIIATNEGILTPNQIEASRCSLSKYIKNIGKVWIKIFPTHAVTKRIKDSRMGSGKGRFLKWVYVVRPGDIIFEATFLSLKFMLKIFKSIRNKLPIKIKLIYK